MYFLQQKNILKWGMIKGKKELYQNFYIYYNFKFICNDIRLQLLCYFWKYLLLIFCFFSFITIVLSFNDIKSLGMVVLVFFRFVSLFFTSFFSSISVILFNQTTSQFPWFTGAIDYTTSFKPGVFTLPDGWGYVFWREKWQSIYCKN